MGEDAFSYDAAILAPREEGSVMAVTRSASSVRLGRLRWLVVAGVFVFVGVACGDKAAEHVLYEDPANDCLSLVDGTAVPAACVPASIDILSVEITRTSQLTIVIEIAAPGQPQLGTDYSIELGLDTDRDPSTGSRNFDDHGIGAELELDYYARESGLTIQSANYTPGGSPGMVAVARNPEWEWLDATHLQIVADIDLVGDTPFAIAGILSTGTQPTPTHFDHFVDGGHLLFPEGDAKLTG